jgi:1L-myo-inositol 1-phosphate cytidylyltransferase / CDP-L-myo-inositol myo-inositolphosphotransferase
VAGAPELPSRPALLPRVGVVLAAGRSERIRSITRGGSKALLRLGGLSLVERAVKTLLAAGVESVVVVVGHDAGPVAAVVDRLGPGRVRAVYADRWEDGNGASLAAVEDSVAGEALFVLLTADHVFGDGAIDQLLATGAPAVLVDASPVRAAWDEGTRVRVVDGAVVAFGKHLREPAIDCGVFLLPPDIFRCQARAAAEGDHTLARAVTGLAQERPLRAVALPDGCRWQDVDSPDDALAAAATLRGSLGKESDGPVSRWLNRPVSTRLSMALAPLRPDPDLVSLAAFVLGLGGAVLLAAGHGVAGALLVHASSVADGVDGEVARLQLRGRPQGALLDGVLDRVGDAAILAGLGLWALDGHDPHAVLALTVAATTGALLSMATKDRATALGLPPAPERTLGWLLGGRDGRLLLVAIGALLGAPIVALTAVTTTSALSVGLRVAFLRRKSGP